MNQFGKQIEYSTVKDDTLINAYRNWQSSKLEAEKDSLKINKAFDSRVRLGLMSILSVNDWISYKEVKNLLDLTDGNLASHVQALEKINFLEIKKQFIGKKPLTTYRITPIGKNAFKDHISGLEKLINK